MLGKGGKASTGSIKVHQGSFGFLDITHFIANEAQFPVLKELIP